MAKARHKMKVSNHAFQLNMSSNEVRELLNLLKRSKLTRQNVFTEDIENVLKDEYMAAGFKL